MSEFRDNSIMIPRRLRWMLTRWVRRENGKLEEGDVAQSVDRKVGQILDEWFAKNAPQLLQAWTECRQIEAKAEGREADDLPPPF